MTCDVVGLPWSEAEAVLNESDIQFSLKRLRPERDFFHIDESSLYVVRCVRLSDGVLELTLAAKIETPNET